MRVYALLFGCLVLAANAHAAPIVGSYASPDAGDDFLSGRWSEAYVGGGQGQVGNTIHAGSWDPNAGTLFSQWELSGPAIASSPVLVDDTVDGDGNGERVWRTPYTGGTMTLTDQGPWWNPADAPDTEYNVAISTYYHTTTKVYVDGSEVPAAQTTHVYMNGTFLEDPDFEVSFLVAVAIPFGEGSSLPPDYPDFVGASEGAWGPVQKIRMSVVPEPASLAVVVAGAGVMLLRRRRRRIV